MKGRCGRRERESKVEGAEGMEDLNERNGMQWRNESVRNGASSGSGSSS